MIKRKALTCLASAVALTFICADASAVMPVVDVRAITQLVNQIRTLQDQLNTARDHLTQARQTFQSLTGGRGMERLLGNTLRNYLPADWAQLTDAVNGVSGAYSALTGEVRGAVAANAVLTARQMSELAPQTRGFIEAARNSAALSQVTTREALAATSGRFASIQQLINAIPGASDPKAVFDLQARIQAELGMLQNEQTKLELLQQTSQAEELARQQREREYVAASMGQFATRFRPTP